MQSLYEQIVALVTKLATALLSFFPRSPFTDFITSWVPPQWLGWLNWFFPVGRCLAIMALWLAAVTTFYLCSIVARWIKVIGD